MEARFVSLRTMRRARCILLIKLLLLGLIIALPVTWSLWIAFAATRTWTGNSISNPNPGLRNNLWTNSENWSGGVAPSANEDLVFPGAAQVTSTNNFLSFTNFNSISITSVHTMQGNSIGLNSGITAIIGNIQLSSITLNNSQTFNATTTGAGPVITSAIDTNGKTLTLDGPGNFNISGVISGGGSLIKMGTGTTNLSGNNSYTATMLNQGTLLVFGDQHSSAMNVNLGVLGGTGTVGTTTAGAFSSISPGAANGTGVLHVNGDLSYPIGSVPANFNVDLNSVTVGTGYDQLVTTGTVFLDSHPTLLTSLGFSPSAGTSFTIIKNDSSSPIRGEFANRPEGSVFTVNGITFGITYKGGNGNDVVLHVPTDRTWDGGGADNKWTTPANWDSDTAPMVGDRLIFPTSPKSSSMNDFPDGTVFTSISVSGGHVIQGKSIGLSSGGIRAAIGIISLSAIKLEREQQFVATTAGAISTITSAIDTNGTQLSFGNAASTGPGDLLLTGIISGAGSLDKVFSSGTVQLSGNNTYTGETAVLDGTLLVLGSQPSSSVRVDGSLGTLGGSGTIGPLLLNRGHISPGNNINAPGILNVNGNFSVSSSATTANFDVNINGATTGQYDQLNVTGTANVPGTIDLGSNCHLNLSLGFAPSPGTTFTLIKNDLTDVVTGEFIGHPEGSFFTVNNTTFFITYKGGDGNDVALHVPTTRTWDGGGLTSNWSEAANWVGDVEPATGDDLVFPFGASRMTARNDFPPDTTFNSITISAGGYQLNGSPLKLVGPFTNANQTPTTNTVSLEIDETSGLTTSGPSLAARLILNAPNLYTGPTMLNSGILTVNGIQLQSDVTVSGGLLEGIGRVKAITANAGVVRPGLSLPLGNLTAGDVTLQSAAVFNAQLVTSSGNTQSTQLEVNGKVSLNGCKFLVLFVNQFAASPGKTYKVIDNDGTNDAVVGTFENLPEGATFSQGNFRAKVSYMGGDGNDVVLTDDSPTVQLSSPNYEVQEDCTTVTVTVNRVGNTSAAASVDYNTSDVTATERKDYITALGKLQFAAGETSKSFVVLINEDSYVEGTETFNVSLSNPSGASLGGTAIATVTITDDAVEPATNAIDDSRTFVCQNYHDFLNRQPDPGGWDFWTNQISSCGADAQCVEVKRINVSASFFLSIEFQETGYLVERAYKAAYADANGNSTFGGVHQLAVPTVRFSEFLTDTQKITQGVIVLQPGWEQQLENNKQAFIADFVQRSRFTTALPTLMTPAQLVDQLFANAGVTPSVADRSAAIGEFGSAADSSDSAARARVLRRVAENPALVQQEFNRAFVLMEYYGYLRRNPNDTPEPTRDYSGYDFWLTKLNQFNGNYINAEMVKAFLSSIEYRERFGP